MPELEPIGNDFSRLQVERTGKCLTAQSTNTLRSSRPRSAHHHGTTTRLATGASTTWSCYGPQATTESGPDSSAAAFLSTAYATVDWEISLDNRTPEYDGRHGP